MQKQVIKDKQSLKYLSLSSQLATLMVVSCWLGYKIDRLIKWKFPIFVIILPLIALIISLWSLVRELSKPKNEE